MKKVVLLLVLAMSTITFAQLEVKENKNEVIKLWSGMGRQSLMKIIINNDMTSDTSYAFNYQDANYSQLVVIESIYFDNIEEVIQFLDLVESAIIKGTKFETAKYNIRSHKKYAIVTPEKGFTYMSVKLVNKIRLALEEKGEI